MKRSYCKPHNVAEKIAFQSTECGAKASLTTQHLRVITCNLRVETQKKSPFREQSAAQKQRRQSSE